MMNEPTKQFLALQRIKMELGSKSGTRGGRIDQLTQNEKGSLG